MSQVTQGVYKTFKAASDLLTTPKKYYVAQLTGDGVVDLASSATQVLIGILQESVKANDNVAVAMIHGGGTSKGVAGATIARGVYLTSDSAGKVVQAAATGDRIIGIALESAVLNDVFELALVSGRHVAGSSASASVSPSASSSPSLSPSSSESASRSPSSSVSRSVSPSASVSPS